MALNTSGCNIVATPLRFKGLNTGTAQLNGWDIIGLSSVISNLAASDDIVGVAADWPTECRDVSTLPQCAGEQQQQRVWYERCAVRRLLATWHLSVAVVRGTLTSLQWQATSPVVELLAICTCDAQSFRVDNSTTSHQLQGQIRFTLMYN